MTQKYFPIQSVFLRAFGSPVLCAAYNSASMPQTYPAPACSCVSLICQIFPMRCKTPCIVRFTSLVNNHWFHKYVDTVLMKFSSNLYDAGFWAHIVVQSVVCAASCKRWRDCLRHCFLLAKDFLCSAMPSCLEAGQRAKLNRTCHSAQSSLSTFFQESLKRFLPLKEMNI